MLKPFIKWPGGKTSELGTIHEYMPKNINHYIEPFLGGGACFLSLEKKVYKKAYLNDFSDELMSIYRYIKEKNTIFHGYLQQIWEFWSYFGAFSDQNYILLKALYFQYKAEQFSKEELKEKINVFVLEQREEIEEGIPAALQIRKEVFFKELQKSILSKFTNMKNNEDKKGDLPEEDYQKNIEAGIRASVYTYNRYLYNEREKLGISRELHIALFFYLREFCYSSMFRYNSSGGFNVPYGGASYNGKQFITKIEYIWSSELKEILERAALQNEDFETFLKALDIEESDFIFLDPPYDTMFSTYANNSFELEDQKRLATYLLTECKGKFMVIIKNTEFIYDLYNKPGIKIVGFDKEYKVSFMDRNEKAVEHLLIMNYEKER